MFMAKRLIPAPIIILCIEFGVVCQCRFKVLILQEIRTLRNVTWYPCCYVEVATSVQVVELDGD